MCRNFDLVIAVLDREVFMQLLQKALVKSTAYIMHCSESGDRKCAVPRIESQLIEIEKHGFSQEPGQLMTIHKISPPGITERI